MADQVKERLTVNKKKRTFPFGAADEFPAGRFGVVGGPHRAATLGEGEDARLRVISAAAAMLRATSGESVMTRRFISISQFAISGCQ